MSKYQINENIVKLVLDLSDELSKIEGITSQDLFPLLPDYDGREPFINAKPIANKIFSLIKKGSGQMVSDQVIMSRLICDVAALRLTISISDSELKNRALDITNKLLGYQATRNVDIPLMSLRIGDNPIKLGQITFFQISPEDKDSEWWRKVSPSQDNYVNSYLLSYARVKVKGDNTISVKSAKTIVREGLLILKGMCFPLSSVEKHQFGIINEFPFWKTVYYRKSIPKLIVHLDFESELTTEIGPSLTVYRLQEDLLNSIPPNILDKFLSLMDNGGFFPENIIQRNILSGFRWIGEATQPDPLHTRYLKLAIALESFIGGEAKNSNITSRGITAMLAERAAFLLGNNLESRKCIDKDIRNYYDKRSKLAHGEISEISSSDFEKFGKLAREIGWSLVENFDKFTTLQEFQNWIVDQRYSG